MHQNILTSYNLLKISFLGAGPPLNGEHIGYQTKSTTMKYFKMFTVFLENQIPAYQLVCDPPNVFTKGFKKNLKYDMILFNQGL